MGEILTYSNHPVSLKTTIKTPDMRGRTVLVENRWDYVRHFINSLPRGKRKNNEQILFYWNQAEEFYHSSMNLSTVSAPLPLYYSFLNAVKALLIYKNESITHEYHGISGNSIASDKCLLSNEQAKILGKGICPEFSKYLGDKLTGINGNKYDIDNLLFNLVFLHRAYVTSHNIKKADELFLPLTDVRFERKPNKHLTLVSKIDPKYSDPKILSRFKCSKVDIWNKDGEFILTWKNGPTLKDKRAINSEDMKVFHTKLRRYYQEISAGSNSRWYFKNFEDDNAVDLNPLVIMLIVMHRLSELSRYNPGILSNYLASDQSWLLSEFISLAPFQFINGISAEITSQQLGIPRSPKLSF
ncbi:hypothetical protein H8Z65_23225 [Mycobacterium avium subsp. hominissuis]|nr:hypothetical protein [Mycobacterium avium subsp. hominissuis]